MLSVPCAQKQNLQVLCQQKCNAIRIILFVVHSFVIHAVYVRVGVVAVVVVAKKCTGRKISCG